MLRSWWFHYGWTFHINFHGWVFFPKSFHSRKDKMGISKFKWVIFIKYLLYVWGFTLHALKDLIIKSTLWGVLVLSLSYKSRDPSYTSSKWWCTDSNPGLFNSTAVFLVSYVVLELLKAIFTFSHGHKYVDAGHWVWPLLFRRHLLWAVGKNRKICHELCWASVLYTVSINLCVYKVGFSNIITNLRLKY